MLFHTPASEDGTEGEDWQGEYLLVKGVSLQRNYPEWRLFLLKKRDICTINNIATNHMSSFIDLTTVN